MKQILLTAMIFMVANPVFAKIIKEKSPLSFNQAMSTFETTLKDKGLTVFAKIDHQKAAKDQKLTMQPAVVYIFGNPKAGTPLMNDNLNWAYELPLKVAIVEDKDGQVWLMSRMLATDISTPTQKERIKTINNLLKTITKQ